MAFSSSRDKGITVNKYTHKLVTIGSRRDYAGNKIAILKREREGED